MHNFISKYWLAAVIVSAIFTTAFSWPSELVIKKNIIKWAVQKTSTLRIAGKTNLAGFGCDINGYYQSDTIVYTESANHNQVIPLKGSLNIDVYKFDCHNRFLTSDLQKTLKASEHPNLVVRFVALERMPSFETNKDIVKGWVDIELAGTIKRFEIPYSLKKTGSIIQLDGGRVFSFADFKLIPPQKMGGLIKVRDDFHVDFNLVLSEVN